MNDTIHKITVLREMYHYGPLGSKRILNGNNKWRVTNDLLNSVKSFDFFHVKLYINVLEKEAIDETEIELINELKNDLLYSNSLFNQVKRLKNRKDLLEAQMKVDFIKNQIRAFNNFKRNQNEYDNIISILKIFYRYQQTFNESLNMDFEFKNEGNDFNKITNEILLKKSNAFDFVRYQL